MPLRALTIGRYKCFERTQTLKLRPLTVLLGRNNSGKSTLARLPLVVSTGMRNTSVAPLELESIGIDVAGGFTDLIYGQRPHGSVLIGQTYEIDGFGEVVVETVVQHFDEYQIQVVSNFKLDAADFSLEIMWDWNHDDPRTPNWRSSHPGIEMGIEFNGLIPARLTGARSIDRPDRLLSLIQREFPSVRYVGPFRERPARFYRLPARPPRSVGVAGQDAPHILADDSIRRDGEIVAAINSYLQRGLPGWMLQVDRQETLYSLVLVSIDDPTIRVNLADTGTGVAQALPILVQRAMDDTQPPNEPVLEIIEQPELHLHPAAHGALADLYIDSLQRQTSCQFLIETYSETFILRLRRRIAEGKLDPADVALQFVEHDGRSATIRRIGIDELGNVDHWPEGIFTEDYDEARALAAAQLSRD